MDNQRVDHSAKRQLHQEVERVAQRFRQRRLWRGLMAVAALGLMAIIGTGIALFRGYVSFAAVWLVTAAVLAAALAIVVFSRRSFRREASLVGDIEDHYPDLQQRLMTALSQQPALPNGQFGFMQHSLIKETVQHARSRHWERIVPSYRAGRAWAAVGVLASAWLLATLATFFIPVPERVAAKQDDGSVIVPGLGNYEIQVTPGDYELERGSHLTVTARFPGRVPARTQLVMTTRDGEQILDMNRSLDDPLFGVHLREVLEPMEYRIKYDDQWSDRYTVQVFEYPALVRSDAILTFPQYTDMPTKEIENVRRVTAVEGTQLVWICHLNKPVVVAQLVDQAGRITHLKPHATVPNAYIADVTLTETNKWELQLVDDKQRHNKHDIHLFATVLPNRPPELKLELARDVRVSPLEELPVKATVSDDFGVSRLGVTYAIPGQEQRDLVLNESVRAKEMASVDHVIDFESLQAIPDQLLTYHFWAEDIGPDGKARRIFSDMFFAEVRPFDEIFREGEQPTASEQARQQQQQQQQGGQNAQRADQLAELQKQIINATWTVVRRETQETPTDKFHEDMTLLIDSQTDAMAQLEELAAELGDEQSLTIAESARTHMQQVVEQLTHVRDNKELSQLTTPLGIEQAAYQDLLGLRAREHEVIRGQQQGQQSGSGSGGNRQQQQLNQLELSNDRNRYETEQQAQAAESTETQRELRQVLNRLGELAKRQQDLNERLQELQSALVEAQTQEERDEIERQLKRLRDQQEELLRDTDELADRMDQEQTLAEQQNSREQLEETRENVRRSADALAEQNIAEALSSGTRAERQFEEMREEIRRQTSNQFAEGVRDMRQQARDLERQQEQVREQLERIQQTSSNQLRDAENREPLLETLQGQRQRLNQLLEQMQQTVLEAEETEPLLAEKLYETYRQSNDNELDRRLDTLEQLVDRGLLEPTESLEQSTREGIGQLREGIEQAAELVLGDETEALRRAANELESLARQLNEEIRRATGRDPENGDGQNRESGEGKGEENDGQPETGQQPGSPQQGDAQQEGQQQGNQQQSGPQQEGQQQGGPQQEGQQRGGQQQGNQQQGGQQQDGQQQGDPQQEGQQQGGQQQGNQQQDGQQQGGPQQEGQQQGGQQQGNQQQDGQQQGGPQQEGQQQGGQQQGNQQQSGQQQGGQQQGGQQQGGQQQGNAQQGGDQPGGTEQQGTQQGQRDGTQRDSGQAGEGGDRRDESEQTRDSRDGGGGLQRFAGESLGGAPLTGDGFRDWSDRLRDVEEMVDDPELRGESARIRERARAVRLEYQRHSKEPEWPLVERMIAEPLESLHQRVSEELLRRTGEQNARVPIDRDPVPSQFSDQVRRYYEQLGGSR